MKMEYKLLGNGTGIILTRQPEIVNDELIITFSGSPSGATAIVEINGDSHYCLLHDATCAIPCAKLNGAVKITVALLDGSAKPKKWLCEGIKASKTAAGVLIAPDDMDLPATVAGLRLENDALRQYVAALENKINTLYGKFERLTEGYDIT